VKCMIVSFLVLLAAPTVASAARLDGNALLARCSTQDVKSCSIYLDGFADALRESPSIARLACIPDGVNGLQLRDVVIKLLHDEPQIRQRTAGALVMRAYTKAWPCPK
jgi:Rap1a immunity proteins